MHAAEPFAAGLNARGLPGVQFRPALFEPTFHKHAQTPCGGCQIHVTDRQTFRPVEAGVALIDAFHTAGPDRFMWREPPYEYEYDKWPIDILYGSSRLREALANVTASAEPGTWAEDVSAFMSLRERFLLY